MPIYRIKDSRIEPVTKTSFGTEGLRERNDLQQMLKANIEVISPDTLIVAEEFGEWEDSRRRIDLLGVDKNANLVVIELKRTQDGGHMELQAIRYAAMISALTFEKLVAIYSRFLKNEGVEGDARSRLLEFLDWEDVDEAEFGQEIRIVLASEDFSKELTTSVMWLNDYGLDIKCVSLTPHVSETGVLLDVQTKIPMPEAAEYQVQIREKKQKERESRNKTKDLTKYALKVDGHEFEELNKRWFMFQLISGILRAGHDPNEVAQTIPWRANRLFSVLNGELSSEEVYKGLMREDTGGKIPRAKRFFSEEGQPFHWKGDTYVLSNQWGEKTEEAARLLQQRFPNINIQFSAVS